MNYKETTATGTSWVRCRAITVTNPFQEQVMDHTVSPPTAYFTEEKVVNLDGLKMLMPAGSCAKEFENTALIPILNPVTGVATGETATHAALYTLLFSLYMQTATERDVLQEGGLVS